MSSFKCLIVLIVFYVSKIEAKPQVVSPPTVSDSTELHSAEHRALTTAKPESNANGVGDSHDAEQKDSSGAKPKGTFQSRSLGWRQSKDDAMPSFNYAKRIGSIKKYIRMFDDIIKKVDDTLDSASKRMGSGLVDIGNIARRLGGRPQQEERNEDLL